MRGTLHKSINMVSESIELTKGTGIKVSFEAVLFDVSIYKKTYESSLSERAMLSKFIEDMLVHARVELSKKKPTVIKHPKANLVVFYRDNKYIYASLITDDRYTDKHIRKFLVREHKGREYVSVLNNVWIYL